MKRDFRKELNKQGKDLERYGVTQAAWAEAAGVDRTTLWRIRQGKVVPSVQTFFDIQNAANQLLAKSDGK